MTRSDGLKLILTLAMLVACSESSEGGSTPANQPPPNKRFELISKDPDDRLTLIDQEEARLLTINKSNRVEDVVSLNMSTAEIDQIRTAKATQDSALKVKGWGEIKLTNTDYSVAMFTRYYKDKLLYRIEFFPAVGPAHDYARTVRVDLRDENGFVLERIEPAQWINMVDETGRTSKIVTNGSVPMTLENYLEVAGYDPIWRF